MLGTLTRLRNLVYLTICAKCECVESVYVVRNALFQVLHPLFQRRCNCAKIRSLRKRMRPCPRNRASSLLCKVRGYLTVLSTVLMGLLEGAIREVRPPGGQSRILH